MSNPYGRPIAKPKRSKHGAKGYGKISAQEPLSDDEDVRAEPVSYEEQKQRAQAARILANHELLIWMSEQRNESLLQTRIYYEARAAGLHDEDLRIDYKMDNTPEKSSSKGSSPAAKARGRVVSASGSSANHRKDKERDQTRRSIGSAR